MARTNPAAPAAPTAGELTACREGVNFEDAQQLVDAIALVQELLRKLGIPTREILVDITGGQKPPTVAGAVASLGEGRRFQYVSTVNDYKVVTYDPTYLI